MQSGQDGMLRCIARVLMTCNGQDQRTSDHRAKRCLLYELIPFPGIMNIAMLPCMALE